MPSLSKRQIKPKADWGAVDSHKNRTNEIVLNFMAKKKQIRLFVFWENLRFANLRLVLSDLQNQKKAVK